MGTPTYVGYAGSINRNGSNNEFNINNLVNDEVTFVFSPDVGGDLILESGDANTLVTITDANGVDIVSNMHIDLLEFGYTGQMNDLVSGYAYTVITVNGVDYMFLDDVHDPTAVAVNPFAAGNSNPLDGNPNTVDPHPICFVNGTRILTPEGERLVEDLRAGDRVVTRDSGVQKILWAGAREMRGAMARNHAPVCIRSGAFGAGLPSQDLYVSPQHRILLSDWRADLLFGEAEVLVAAKHLVNDTTIRVAPRPDIYTYHHILFEKHETVMSNGLPTESFHPGPAALDTLTQAVRDEVLELFPELAEHEVQAKDLSHMPLKAFEAKAMLRL